MLMTLLVVLVHRTGTTAETAGLGLAVDVLQVGGLGHSVWRGRALGRRGGQQLAQGLEACLVLKPSLLRELDGELDVQVAVVVVAVRRHTLATNHLDRV
jgi:hypothetical protein